MKTTRTIAETRTAILVARGGGRSIGFVPTMGALHAGHRSLVEHARRRCGYVVVSVFVNPTQFAVGEDFERYPRDLETDLRECQDASADLVFAPDTAEMYPGQPLTAVHVAKRTATLCGRFRPGHFDGVTMVVAKLFNIVCPDVAFFGEKDYQQLVTVRRMVRDLNMPVDIVACPTVREPDGLAVSSRNRYLTPDQRTQAACLYRAMEGAAEGIRRGQTDARRLMEQMRRTILAAGAATIDYASIVDPESLEDVTVADRPVRLCLAVRIGECRLIDNMGVDAPRKDR